MPQPILTREIARAIATDEINRKLKREGRSQWNEAAWNLACEIFQRLTDEAREEPQQCPVTSGN